MDKTLNYLALARKAGLAELGEEPVGAITRALKGHLVLVAQDASDHTWRRAKSFVAGTNQQCIKVPFTKDEMGMVLGRTSLAIAALTDPAMALAFVKALPEPEAYTEALQNLAERTQRIRQRRDEEKAHQRNKRFGRTKRN